MTSSLQFQPRMVGVWALAATVAQSPAAFAALSGVLWWGCLLPRFNLFDFAHNRTLGRRAGATLLSPAPLPRRFAQGMAGTFAAAIALSLVADARTLAGVLQAFFLVAVAAQVFGRFCMGSFVYHLLRGRFAFALATLPWGRGDRTSA